MKIYTVEIGYTYHLDYTRKAMAMLAAKRAATSKQVVMLSRFNTKTGERDYINPDGTISPEGKPWNRGGGK